ncbi:13974_t:CDS:10 [Dentiscutata heterogama]|uniref:13974_t:CDS:1 n=1 Tax=Dentiscutata heterogama TaxID=1316150 RepID=A0ACA9KC65_9GLOM|nr:13974_t:CDS:10 [Dentiscutata heterogama]
MWRSTTGLCNSSDWGPVTNDRLDLTPCAREVILNATLPICAVIYSIIYLAIHTCRGQSSIYTPLVFTGRDVIEQEHGYVPVSKYDISQLVISFIQLGFVGFLFGWEIEKDHSNGLYMVVGAIGQFTSWIYIVILLACHFMTRRNQTQYAFIRQLLILYTLLFIVACLNLRSMLINKENKPKGYERVFAIWNFGACGILFACSLKRPRNPELRYARNRRVISHDTVASIWSLLTFGWMSSMVRMGNRRSLTEDDLWELPYRCQAAHCYYELDQILNPSLLTRLLRVNTNNLLLFLFIAIFRSIFSFTTPFFLYKLLEYITNNKSNEYTEEPYIYVFGILCSELARILFLNQLNYQVVWLGIRVEQMLSVLVYSKQLHIKTSSRSNNNRSNNNVLTTDVGDIAGFFSNLPFLLTIPLEIIVAIIGLYYLLGVSSIIGIAIMILCLWSSKRFGRRVSRLQKRVKKARDERVSDIFELLHVVRTIKMYGWENSFHERLMYSRTIELNQLRRLFWRTTYLTLLVHLTPFLVTLFAFAFYTFVFKNSLSPACAFTSIILFNTLKQPLQNFPNLVVELVGLGVSVRRVERFLNEIDIQKDISMTSSYTKSIVGFSGVDVSWSYDMNILDPNDFSLRDVNLEFPLGKLSIIYGPKSSGKTLLFLSLLRETFLLRGIINFPSNSVAYVPQQTWIENTTIRDNILFGSAFIEERYWNIVDACCLHKDFENMDEADFTKCDEKDIILKDDQKARIALARALYSSAQILLLDDFLSIMDPLLAHQIIENCLKSPIIDGRTVIIATYYVRSLLDVASYIAILGNGTVLASGTPEQVRESGYLNDEILGSDVDVEKSQDKNFRNSLIRTYEKYITDKKIWTPEEAQPQGKIPLKIYLSYFKSSGGLFIWFMLIFLFITIRVLTVGETYWLNIWSEWSEAHTKLANTTSPELLDDNTRADHLFYIGIYAAIALSSAIFTIVRMIWQLYVSLKGSRILFSELLNAILRAPLSFFDTAPLGNIMNRFSKDLGIIDQSLMTVLSSCLGNAVGVISVLAVVTAITYEFFFVSIVVGAIASYFAGIFILWKQTHGEPMSGGLAGFCLSYALGFVQIVFMLVKDYSTMENNLNSVERIKEYIDMPQESLSVASAHPPAAWPTDGKIEVSHLTINHALRNEPVLQNLSFYVRDKEKIGIIGRAGAGKSTLANSFLRLVEANEGRIVIDGIDIADISLEDLRSRLAIISQEPILFEGTIRSNLDIRLEYEDDDLWESLRRARLIHIEVEGNRQALIIGPITSLDDPVNEGGSNFSRGQRQLICFARALLRQPKVLTANLDTETDKKIQEIIHDEFQDSTVLNISHQFKNIINSDRILVLDQGEIVEFDTPSNLMMNPESLFRQMSEQDGTLQSLMKTMKLNYPEDEDEEEHFEEHYDDDDVHGMEIEIEDEEEEDDEQTERESEHEVDEEQENNQQPEMHDEQHHKDDWEV